MGAPKVDRPVVPITGNRVERARLDGLRVLRGTGYDADARSSGEAVVSRQWEG